MAFCILFGVFFKRDAIFRNSTIRPQQGCYLRKRRTHCQYLRQQNSEVKNASSAKDIFKILLDNVSKINTCKKVEKEREAGLRQMLIGEFFKF